MYLHAETARRLKRNGCDDGMDSRDTGDVATAAAAVSSIFMHVMGTDNAGKEKKRYDDEGYLRALR